MKILLSSYVFPPSVGGTEEVGEIIARGLAARGHSVRVVTMTPSTLRDAYPFEIVRQPSPARLLECVRWCDAYLQVHISLRFAWPLLLAPRPWVVSIHAPIHGTGLTAVRNFVKRMVLRLARVTAVSKAMSRGTGRRTTIVTNPYRTDVFRYLNSGPRPCELVFLGRLVSDKGIDLLITALGRLRERGLTPRLMVIGRGPEDAALRAQCERLHLGGQVEFAGYIPNDELVLRLNQCRIMVIPSVWEEGFGVVALQGIACGCVVVSSDAGGLREAIGPCGITFPNGNVPALADRLAELLQDERKVTALRLHSADHLSLHEPQAVADAYLSIIEGTRRSWRGGHRTRSGQ